MKFRYVFNHIISIASFLDLMSSRLRPPSSMGRCRNCAAILGLASWPHMKLDTIFATAVSMAGGIPCAFVKNWVWPPTIACMIRRLPFKVGCALSHFSSFDLMVSRMGSQGVASFAPFPIHAPRIRTASFSCAIRILPGRGCWSSWLIFLVDCTCLL